jgi:hypothetical protein
MAKIITIAQTLAWLRVLAENGNATLAAEAQNRQTRHTHLPLARARGGDNFDNFRRSV